MEPLSTGENISKNALKKKEEDLKLKEEEKARKVAEMGSAKENKSQTSDDQDMDPTQYMENGLKHLTSEKAEGKNPYPHNFPETMSIEQYIENYRDLNDGQHLGDVSVSLAGQIKLKHASGAKIVFYDLADGVYKVQVIADVSQSHFSEAEFAKFHSNVKRGDTVGITGFPGKSKKGELSIFSKTFVVLAPCLHMMPRQKPTAASVNANNNAWVPGSTRNSDAYILKDQETRYRSRHLDLMLNPEVREIFKTRSKIISYIRRFLDKLDFLEIETPMMNVVAGGAAA